MSNLIDCANGLGILVEVPLATNLPSYHMWIKTTHSKFAELSSTDKKYAMMHALGHLIRLNDAENKKDYIDDTSLSIESIMLSYDYLQEWGLEWTGFTANDKSDLKFLYPLDKVIVTDVSLQPVVDTELSSNTLKLYKPYDFKTSYTALKRGNKEFKYNYDISGGDYEKVQLNDSTVRIIFNETGYYDIKVTLESDSIDETHSEILDDYERYFVVGDDIVYPNSITRNVPFELYWRYTNKQYPDATIVFSGVEHLFDLDASNIAFKNVSNGRTIVTLKDFGQFTITMKAIKPNGEVLKEHKLHIEEYYHPQMDVIDTCSYFKEIPFDCFSIGRDICEEDLTYATKTDIINTQALAVRLDNRNSFGHRCYIKAYKKYHRKLFDFARRVDVRHVTDTSDCMHLLFQKGDIALYLVPSQKLYMSAGVGGLGPDESADYTSYMTFIIPDDTVRFE